MTPKQQTADVVFRGLEAGLRMFRWVVLILLVLFLVSGISKIEPDSVGLLLRFGKLQGATPGERVRAPGLVLALPFPIDVIRRVPGAEKEGEVLIDEVWKEIGQDVTTDTIDPVLEGYCLTGDQNILQLKVTVKYKVSDPIAFELWMDKEDREALLRDVVLAALTQTVAGWTMDDALRLEQSAAGTDEGPAEEAAEVTGPAVAEATGPEATQTVRQGLAKVVWRRAQERLDALSDRGASHGCGMTISALEFEEAHPPRHVVAEFRRVQDEKINMERLRQQARGFANREIPNAEAKKNNMIQSAIAYRDAVTAAANADVFEFKRLFEQYQKSPTFEWRRIYQEAIEQVLANVKRHRFVSPGTEVIIPETNGEDQP